MEIKEENLLDGTMEDLVIDGVSDVIEKLPYRPKAVLVYTSCVHHFTGCDLDMIYVRMRERYPDIDFTDCYMNPIMRKSGLTPDQLSDLMNKKSGFLGVSGVSSDCRDIRQAAKEGNERAQLALKVFAHKVRFYIGAYIAEMNGVDAIVFTAGVGENDMGMRDIICNDLGNLGIKLDVVKNRVRGKEMIISRDDSPVKIILIPTNEELMIARDTLKLVKGIA